MSHSCGATPWSSGSVLDHRSLPPVFESRREHIWRLFHISLRSITFGSRSAHLAYLVHKSGRKHQSSTSSHSRVPRALDATVGVFHLLWAILFSYVCLSSISDMCIKIADNGLLQRFWVMKNYAQSVGSRSNLQVRIFRLVVLVHVRIYYNIYVTTIYNGLRYLCPGLCFS